MSVNVIYKNRTRTYDGSVEKTGETFNNHWGTELAGFRMPDIYASTHEWFLTPEALEALVKAQNELLEEGYSIILVEAHRSYEKQAEAHRKKPGLAVSPEVSKHPRGTAVDARMWDEDIGDFDADDEGTWGDQDYLAEVMAKHGWKRTVMPKEPWHFDYRS